jgi:hypothetical protein
LTLHVGTLFLFEFVFSLISYHLDVTEVISFDVSASTITSMEELGMRGGPKMIQAKVVKND